MCRVPTRIGNGEGNGFRREGFGHSTRFRDGKICAQGKNRWEKRLRAVNELVGEEIARSAGIDGRKVSS